MPRLRFKHGYRFNIIVFALVGVALIAYAIFRVFFSHAANFSADFNGDGIVDVRDLTILAAHFHQNSLTKALGDADGNDTSDIQDFAILAVQWGTNPVNLGAGRGAGYNRLGFYTCDQSNVTYGAQQVQCYNNLASWLGRTTSPKIPYVVLMTDSSSPSTMSGNGWGAVVASGAFQTLNPKPTIVLSVPLAFGSDGCSNSPSLTTCFDKVADGTYDAQYRSLLQYFIDAGYSNNLIIRLGWEYDGDWMPWSARNNPAQFVAAYRHVHDVMRAMTGMSGLRFDLAGDPGQVSPSSVWQSGNQTYPGDAYVDIIGMDVYSHAPSSNVCLPDSFSTTTQPSLTAQENFAITHGKVVSYPEWGQKTDPDCPNFVQDMNNWFNSLPTSGAGSLEYHSYFNTASNEGSNSSFRLYDAINNLPLSNALNSETIFKTLFGG